MAFHIEMPDGNKIIVDGVAARIGRDPNCHIAFPNEAALHPTHARIRRVGNKWLIQTEGDWEIQVGSAAPGRMSWLSQGDIIYLTPSGPMVIFHEGIPLSKPVKEEVLSNLTSETAVQIASAISKLVGPVTEISEPTALASPPTSSTIASDKLKWYKQYWSPKRIGILLAVILTGGGAVGLMAFFVSKALAGGGFFLVVTVLAKLFLAWKKSQAESANEVGKPEERGPMLG